MTAEQKKPGIVSAAGVARYLSRLLKREGFKMADTSDRYKWTEGYHVSRIGYSNLVNVDYHLPRSLDAEGDRAKRKAERERIRKFLTDRGYPLDPRQDNAVYVVCEGD